MSWWTGVGNVQVVIPRALMGFTHLDARVALMDVIHSDAKTGLAFQDNEPIAWQLTWFGNSLGALTEWQWSI